MAERDDLFFCLLFNQYISGSCTHVICRQLYQNSSTTKKPYEPVVIPAISKPLNLKRPSLNPRENILQKKPKIRGYGAGDIGVVQVSRQGYTKLRLGGPRGATLYECGYCHAHHGNQRDIEVHIRKHRQERLNYCFYCR
jgi:hypothetical protein